MLGNSLIATSLLFQLVFILAIDENRASAIMSDQSSKGEKPPIIGVFTQVLRDYKRFTDKKKFHLASSYVKWIEAAGGQVLPVLLNRDDEYYERVFRQTNGLLFPGGDNLLNPNLSTPLIYAAKKMYKLAVEANDRGDKYPIWGTCLGMELLTVLSSDQNQLAICSAVDITLPVEFVNRGTIFAPRSYANVTPPGFDLSSSIMDIMSSSRNVTYNQHHKCITNETLETAGLKDFYKPLAYSNDTQGSKFIAIFEASNYPFYGVQFHPEKPPFEFQYVGVPHSDEAIAVSRFLADFFVSQAKLNRHKVPPEEKVSLHNRLIYSYSTTFTSKDNNDQYEARYIFPFLPNPNTTDCEFLDHIPADDENYD